MFCGHIQGLGHVVALEHDRLSVATTDGFVPSKGSDVCVAGVRLSVEAAEGATFVATLSAETQGRTTLVERAMELGLEAART